VGLAAPRVDGRAKVTGACRFVSDHVTPETLRIAVHRSTVPHARITGVDVTRARSVPGVAAVLTARDLIDVDPTYGLALRDQRIVASKRVRFIGDVIAVVVAGTRAAAEEAAARIEVAYAPLPAVFNVEAALRPDAPVLHDTAPVAGTYLDLRDLAPVIGTNIAHRFIVERGGVDRAWAGCAVVITETYRFHAVNHGTLEPDVVMARWDDGGVTITSSTRHPFQVRADISRMFGVPEARVRVIVPPIGGAFGSKAYTRGEPLAVAAARAVPGRTVAYVLTPEEEFLVKRRLPAVCTLTSGFAADGTLLAHTGRLCFDIGAYAGHGPRIAQKAAYTATGPYRIPHVRLEALAVYTNNVPGSAFRGYGVPQVAWAMEGQMDRAAQALNLTGIEIRERNLLRRGEIVAEGDLPADGEFSADLQTLVARFARASGRRPAGVACALKASNPATVSEARLSLNARGRVDLTMASAEFGQGAWTALAQIAAAELGVPLEAVRPNAPDTARAPYDQGTGSSRTTTVMGRAVQAAARGLRAELARRAAVDPAFRIEGLYLVAPGRRIALETLCSPAVSVTGRALGGEAGRGGLGGTVPFWELGMAAVDVEVDCETGVVRIPKYYTLADVGCAINPQQCESQEFGAAVMGLGHTLLEAVQTDEGAVLNSGLIGYRLPQFGDVPDELVSILVEGADGSGPYGAKGLGESGLLATAPAVAGALYHAFGLDLRELPLTPEQVWRALRLGGGR
jgi:CO/xanthine dehydrogenase Mo-binding subunit